LLGRVKARLDSGGEAVAEQHAAVLASDWLAGGQDPAVGGGLGALTHLREKGEGLLQAEPFGLIPLFDHQHGHRNPSQGTQLPRVGLLPIHPSKFERDTLRRVPPLTEDSRISMSGTLKRAI